VEARNTVCYLTGRRISALNYADLKDTVQQLIFDDKTRVVR
jgi:hypothetical protein